MPQVELPLVAAAMGMTLSDLPLAPAPSLSPAASLGDAQKLLSDLQTEQLQVRRPRRHPVPPSPAVLQLSGHSAVLQFLLESQRPDAELRLQ